MSNHWFGVRPPAGAWSATKPGDDIRHAAAPNTLATAVQAVSNAGAKRHQAIGVPVTHKDVGGAIHIAAHTLALAEWQVVVECRW